MLMTSGALLMVLAYFACIHLLQKADSHAEQIELRALFDRWVDAGKPTGEQLASFMQGRRQDFLINSQSFAFEQTNYVGVFALTNLVSQDNAQLVITTNKVLLLVVSNRIVEVIRFSAPPF